MMRRPRRARGLSRIERGLEMRAGWWDRLLEQPVLWGLLAVVVCSALLMPRSAARLPEWPAGEVAAFDVTVPRDVTLPDEAATEALREEARVQVRPVYDLEERLGDEVQRDVGALFDACRAARADGGVELSELTAATDLRVEPEMVQVLERADCSPELGRALREVVDQVYRGHVVDDLRSLERRGSGGITLRSLADGGERLLTLGRLPDAVDVRDVEDAVQARLFEQDVVQRRWLKATTEFLAGNLPPDIVFNRAETAVRVQAAADQVAPRSQVLRRGQVLIRRGDAVTPAVARTLQLLAAERGQVARLPVTAGVVLLVSLVVLGWWQLVWRYGSPFERAHRLSLVFVLMLVFVGLERLALLVGTAVALNSQGPVLSNVDAYLWGLPHAAGPIAALLLLGLPAAVLFSLCQALLVGVMLGGAFEAVLFALSSGVIAVLAAQRYRDRSLVLRAGLLVGLGNVAVFGVLELYGGLPSSPGPLLLGAVAAFLGGPVAVGIGFFLLPVLEGLFGITTDLRLLELSNQNLPLLKQLSLQAPGTYQHSLTVGNLAEAGAEAVGANGLLLRVCSYYHDVGKLVKPEYFVENQHGVNPHDQIVPSMSSLVIMSHVKEGLEIARRARLPLPIRQAIATHHGTKLIRYFYEKARQRTQPGTTEVRESDYRYPGPKPHTKELGILLLADAVEAAARTLENPTPPKIQAMINRIFSDALADGQLDQTELTFKELDKVASAFMWVLTNMFHNRIDYPGFDFNRRQPKRDSGIHHLGTKTAAADG